MTNFPILPKHIGIIMDGNGRWAKQNGLPRIMGHKNGINSVQSTVEACLELGIEALTLYAFSTENWVRPKDEVNFLMQLFQEYLQKELDNMLKNNIQFLVIGRNQHIPDKTIKLLQTAVQKTQSNTGLKTCLAFDYGSRQEIVHACRSIANKVKNNELAIEDIDEQTINNHLYTNTLPELDLIIRTSGELRLSNFLLWQAAYTEFYFTDIYWPDFSKQEFFKALESFANRQRRKGNIA